MLIKYPVESSRAAGIGFDAEYHRSIRYWKSSAMRLRAVATASFVGVIIVWKVGRDK
jgi:hypothetical protein